MPHRILTPNTHSEETLDIANDLIPAGYELVTAPHGRPEFWNLLKDTEFYIGGGQFKHGPEFYSQAPKIKLVQTLTDNVPLRGNVFATGATENMQASNFTQGLADLGATASPSTGACRWLRQRMTWR